MPSPVPVLSKELSMLNLAPVRMPSAPVKHEADGLLDKLVLWGRQQLRYRRALHELRQLDNGDLDDINVARADCPELAWRHATGAEPRAQLRG
jgi:uncharacterized protein YjiS (DUF1127 family)